MNVKELIKVLNKVKDKNKQVFVYLDSSIYQVSKELDELDDRVDINLGEME